jgi:hypothetical protein
MGTSTRIWGHTGSGGQLGEAPDNLPESRYRAFDRDAGVSVRHYVDSLRNLDFVSG